MVTCAGSTAYYLCTNRQYGVCEMVGFEKRQAVLGISPLNKEIAMGWYFYWTGSDRVEWSRRTREVTDVAWRRLSK